MLDNVNRTEIYISKQNMDTDCFDNWMKVNLLLLLIFSNIR